jgi:hypothetical protein
MGALCAKEDPDLWDPDTHHHVKLGRSDCWMCEEARDVCLRCPVFRACEAQAVRYKESHCIRAAQAWTGGRPRSLSRRRY